MNSLLKIGIVGGLVALVVWGTKAAKQALAAFTYEVTGFGKPSISSFQLTVPVNIKFGNPTPLSINVDQLIADIYLLKNNAYVIAARLNQPTSIPSGTSVQTYNVKVDLKSLFGGNVFNTTQAIAQIYQSRKLPLRIDVTAVYQGITLPKQTFDQTVDI